VPPYLSLTLLSPAPLSPAQSKPHPSKPRPAKPRPGPAQEIYKDRQKFSDQVFRVASSDLVNMGISVVSYTLKDVHDEQAIAAQQGEVALVERAQRAQLQEQEVGRRRQELEATVRKPAEAERYRLERLAEAHR
ncbi:Flotillin-1, partial [Lamprotornis superbus]